MRRGVIAIVVLLAIGLWLPGAVAGAPDSGEQWADIAVDEADEATSNETTGNESAARFGRQVSSFVQSTNTEADGTVEQGMWESRMTENGTPEDISERAGALEDRLSEARAERERLRAARENGSITRMEYASRMAQLNGEIRSIASAADDTAAVATELGAETESLEETRQAAAAAGSSPVDVPGIPPTDEASNGVGQATDTPADDTPGGDIPENDALAGNRTPGDGAVTGNDTLSVDTDTRLVTTLMTSASGASPRNSADLNGALASDDTSIDGAVTAGSGSDTLVGGDTGAPGENAVAD